MSKKPVIRCDDYPYGDPRHISLLVKKGKTEQEANQILRQVCWQVMQIFEKYDVNYVWGVSPLLLQSGDIEAINTTCKKGRVVMHGFDHGVSVFTPVMWEKIHKFYHLGGEYCCYDDPKILLDDYKVADKIMKYFNRYDPTIFIPPFNAYNQVFLDCISNTQVQTLFINDTEHEKFLKDLFHHHLKLSISKEGHSYTNVNYAVENWEDLQSEDHICLHPIYDYIDFGAQVVEKYQQLGELARND